MAPPAQDKSKLYPASPYWTIYTVQKNLTGVGALGNGHNFLRLVDPTGETRTEVHGNYDRQFTVFGPVPANYLQIMHFVPFGFRNDLTNVASRATLLYRSGAEAEAALRRAFVAVAGYLDRMEALYVGVRFIPFGERAVNSNSVWRTLLTELGVKNPLSYSGGLNTPGDRTDLSTAPSNNAALLLAEQQKPPGHDPSWYPNPTYDQLRADSFTPPKTRPQ